MFFLRGFGLFANEQHVSTNILVLFINKEPYVGFCGLDGWIKILYHKGIIFLASFPIICLLLGHNLPFEYFISDFGVHFIVNTPVQEQFYTSTHKEFNGLNRPQ